MTKQYQTGDTVEVTITGKVTETTEHGYVVNAHCVDVPVLASQVRDVEVAAHDGNLDNYPLEGGHAEAWLEKKGIGIHVYGTKRDTYLDAKQALSLLAWLKQEESTLQKLAKEQGQ